MSTEPDKKTQSLNSCSRLPEATNDPSDAAPDLTPPSFMDGSTKGHPFSSPDGGQSIGALDDTQLKQCHDGRHLGPENPSGGSAETGLHETRTKMPEIKVIKRLSNGVVGLDRKNLQTQDGTGQRANYRENLARITDKVRIDDEKMKKIHRVSHNIGRKKSPTNAKTSIENYMIHKKKDSSRERSRPITNHKSQISNIQMVR